MAADETLHAETRFFEQNKDQWLQSHPGEFVVIIGTAVEGFFKDYESAFKAGIKKAKPSQDFLVKQVWAEEPVYLIF